MNDRRIKIIKRIIWKIMLRNDGKGNINLNIKKKYVLEF